MDDGNKTPAGQCKYSCSNAGETLEWINAIIGFIQPLNFLIMAQVVNFFTDRLWEALDKEWIDCLRNEPVEHLVLMPSGALQDHWPASLKQFILTARSLAFPSEQVNLQKVFSKLNITSIEVLSAIVSSTASEVGAEIVVDMGAGMSAERWSCLENDAGLQNFDLHAFRAVFQMVLFKHYPRSITASPSVGCQGKALRRKQRKGSPWSLENSKENKHLLESSKGTGINQATQPLDSRMDDNSSSEMERSATSEGSSCNRTNKVLSASTDKCTLFEKFSLSGLSRLGLEPLEEINFHEIWSEAQPSAELIGHVLETLILLDRLLFIQEQDGIEDAAMLPIF